MIPIACQKKEVLQYLIYVITDKTSSEIHIDISSKYLLYNTAYNINLNVNQKLNVYDEYSN